MSAGAIIIITQSMSQEDKNLAFDHGLRLLQSGFSVTFQYDDD